MTYDIYEYRGRKVVGFMSPGRLDRLAEIITTHKVNTVLELGAFVGSSTCFFAERVEHVWTVDNFDVASQDYQPYLRKVHEPAAQDQYGEFLRNTLTYRNITGIRMDFMEAARLPLEADLVYIDAVQRYEKHKELVEAFLPKAKKVIAGDDASNSPIRTVAEELGAESDGLTWWKAL